MLPADQNELLCRTGAGTPMGELLRRYWVPVALASEIPAPDSPPARVRIFGEQLVAFRATSGAIGLVQDACPHRRASLFWGRNEEDFKDPRYDTIPSRYIYAASIVLMMVGAGVTAFNLPLPESWK